MSKHMTNTHKNKYKQTKQTNKRKIKFSTNYTSAQFVEDPNGKIKARTRHKVPCKVLTVTMQHTLQQHATYIRQL